VIKRLFRRLIFLIPVIAVLAVLIPTGAPAMANASTLSPSADGTTLQLYPSTGTTHYNLVSDSNDGTFVWDNPVSWETDIYNLSDLSPAGNIVSVVVWMRTSAEFVAYAATHQPSARTVLRVEGVDYYGAEETPPSVSGYTYAEYGTTYTTVPGTSRAWNWTDINNLQAGVSLRKAGDTLVYPSTFTGAQTRCSKVWVVVNYQPLPTLSINDVTVAEGDQGPTHNAILTVSLSAASPAPVTFKWATADGTATGDYPVSSGDDYQISSSNWMGETIPAGQTTFELYVPIVPDMTLEPDETFYINISDVTGATVVDNQGVCTIANDDGGLSINDVSLTEGSSGTTNFVFTVTLTPASLLPVSVTYQTASGTAGQSVDFSYTYGTLNFSPGQTTKTITVPVIGDTIHETNETFTVSIYSASGAHVTDSSGTGTIIDDDPVPSLSINDVMVTEGNSGNTNAVFTVTMSNGSSSNVNVHYATADGTAMQPGDYTYTDGDLTFAPGGALTQTITVPVVGDTTVEANETFTVTLSGASGATISDGIGQGTITNDDVVVLPNMSINDVTVTEGNSATTNANFTVTLSSASASEVTVNYATAGGTATAGTDYTSTSGILTISSGSTTGTIAVPIVGDTTVESNETFYVNLSGASGATITDAQGVGTITNDDVAPSNLSINDVTVTEGNSSTTSAIFTVTLSPSSSSTVTVDYSTGDVTATQPSDYTLTSGTLTFAVGDTTKTISVPVIGDTTPESNETFNVVLSNPTNAVIADGTGVGSITDDDITVGFTSSSYSLNESWGGTYAIVSTLQLSKTSSSDVTVNYTLSGTATYGVDYTVSGYTPGVGGSITILGGSITQALNFNVINDTLDEPDETIIVTLTGATNAAVSGTTVFTGTIIDNDSQTATLSVNDVSVTEGNTGTTDANFTVSLSTISGWTVAVHYATADGTANAGTDYNSISGDLTFSPGETSKTVTVQVTGDTAFESDETFNVNLSSPVNATISDSQGVGTISNDDQAVPTYILSMAVSPAGSGSASDDTGTGPYIEGASVSISASPNAGYVFVNWTATAGTFVDSNSASTTFTMPGEAATVTANFAPVITPTTLTVSPAVGTYGGTVDLSATLTATEGGTPINGKTITFILNGSSAGSAVTDASGVATLSSVNLGSINANTYTTGIGASFAGDSTHGTSSGNAQLTVNPKGVTVTAEAKSKTYGDDDPILTYTSSDSSATFSGALERVAGENAGTYAINQGTLVGTGNYAISSYVPASLTINPKGASVTPNAASKTYGDADPTFTGTLTGFLSADSVTADYSRTSGETVAGSPYTISAVLNPAGVLTNYTITYNTADFTINPAHVTILYTGDQIVKLGETFEAKAQLTGPNAASINGIKVCFFLDDDPTGGNPGEWKLGEGTTGSMGVVTLSPIDTDGWISGVYTVIARTCDSNVTNARDEATFTVADPGDAATGGGWYTLGGSGRVNFGFTVRKIPDTDPAQYKGKILLINNEKWRLKGDLNEYVSVDGHGAASGTGMLYLWDITLNDGLGGWVLYTEDVNFTISFADLNAGGATGKAKKTVSPDTFGIHIDCATGDGDPVLPNSEPTELKGGNIDIKSIDDPIDNGDDPGDKTPPGQDKKK